MLGAHAAADRARRNHSSFFNETGVVSPDSMQRRQRCKESIVKLVEVCDTRDIYKVLNTRQARA